MRTRIPTFITAIALTASGTLMAQSFGEIHGKVKDDQGKPVEMANVSASQGEHRFSVYTDEEGRFVLKPLSAGVYDVRVVMLGQPPQEVSGVLVDPDKITFLQDLSMVVGNTLDPLIVVRTKWVPPLIKVDDPEVVSLFHTQWKHDPSRHDPVKLASLVAPGVTRAPNGDGLFFRGSRSENMCYYVDGMKVGDKLSAVPSEAINSISVYTGGLPAKYGDVTGGVIAIETKSYFDLYQQRNAGIR